MGLQLSQDSPLNNLNPSSVNQASNPNNLMQNMNKSGNQKKSKNTSINQAKNNQQNVGQMASPNQMFNPNPNQNQMNMNFNEDFGQMNPQVSNNMYLLGDNNFGLEGMN